MVDLFGMIKRTTSRLTASSDSGMFPYAYPVFAPLTGTPDKTGSAADEDSNAEYVADDRSLRIQLDRDDAACAWCYEHDVTVYNSIQRRIGVINNGFDILYTDSKENFDTNEFEEFKNKTLNEITNKIKLGTKLESALVNKYLYGFGVLRKQMIANELVRLVELDSSECKPIRDLSTNELGGPVGKGLDEYRPEAEIAMVQYGKRPIYTALGTSADTLVYFYFTRDEIIPIGNMDRGKFIGISPVLRIIRLVEIKKTLENCIDLLVRRYGPQIWLTIGNEKMNFSNTEIPPSYYTDTNGNPVDMVTARNNYKTAILNAIQASVQSFADSTSLIQLAEFGISPQIFNPSSSLMDYKGYLDKIDDAIKTAILGLDIPGRIDVTSSLMQDKLTRDLKDSATKERNFIETILNEDLFAYYLKREGKSPNYARLIFKPLDRTEAHTDAEIEKLRSETIYNYAKAGFTKIPTDLKVKWNLADIENSMITPAQQKDYLKQTIKDNPNNTLDRKRLDDINKGR